ncbi:hypothetical protein ACIBBB_08365 [Streptomyces sp. NPDC051217]|uniref:hypothetical protein n=1 Tax=Streptomyces sp. NPDC051217 TaxID=3365644 RepID=UPI0037BC1157
MTRIEAEVIASTARAPVDGRGDDGDGAIDVDGDCRICMCPASADHRTRQAGHDRRQGTRPRR